MPQPISCNHDSQTDHAQLYEILIGELTDVAVFLIDAKGCIVSWNPGVERLLGYHEKEWLGHSAEIIFTPEDRAQGIPSEELTKAARDGRAPDFRWHLRKSGERLFVEGTLVALRDDAGDLLGFSKLMRDVTEQKRMQRALAHSKERLKQIFAQAPVGFAVFRGRDFIIELANPAYQNMLRGRDLLGRKFADVVPELPQNVWDAFHRVLDFGETFLANELYISYDQDGDGIHEDHWFNVVYHPLREQDEAVSGIITVSSEVTLQVLARKETERVNRELEEFAYVASHDLQEPLRMVNIYSQMILKSFRRDDPKLDQFAGYVRQGVDRMEALIRDLLVYSRTAHRDATPVGWADLTDSLDQALAILTESIKESGAIIVCSALPVVRGETRQLAHVFQNLISNALKYRNGSVAPRIEITVESHPDHVIIAVKDNGIGFEPAYAEQIFGLFKRLHKDEYPGTGLGLAICSRIIERYGGSIWAEGRPGNGATFFFSLGRGHRS